MSSITYFLLGILFFMLIHKRKEIYKELKKQDTGNKFTQMIVVTIHVVFLNPFILLFLIGVALGTFVYFLS